MLVTVMDDLAAAVVVVAAHEAAAGHRVRRSARLYADLVAACRAGLLAAQEGDSDPWWYLRDELPPAPPGHPLDGPETGPETGQETGQETGPDTGPDAERGAGRWCR